MLTVLFIIAFLFFVLHLLVAAYWTNQALLTMQVTLLGINHSSSWSKLQIQLRGASCKYSFEELLGLYNIQIQVQMLWRIWGCKHSICLQKIKQLHVFPGLCGNADAFDYNALSYRYNSILCVLVMFINLFASLLYKVFSG